MKRIHIFLLAGLLLTAAACKDNLEYGPLVRDNRPEVPVTFTNATTYGGTPYIEVSIAANTPITFTLSIPASSGRSIKTVAVVGGTTGVNAGSFAGTTAGSTNGTANLFQPAPIAGSGTTATFSTTLAAFKTRYPSVATTPTGNPVSPREVGFIFLVTLDDGTQIVTIQTRARILA